MIALYVRQSVDKKDSISIESQIEFCKREVGGEEFKVYDDKGYSGKNTNRPKFQAMMDDVKVGKISKIIVYKLDRISRSVLDFSNIMVELNKYNVEFASTTEKFDTSTPMGKAMLNIAMVFAQLERETIQMRVKHNYYERGKIGMYLGGQAPYGFIKVETKFDSKKTYTLEPNPEQLPYLLQMYDFYANTNMSLSQISSWLNNKEIPAAEGGAWDSSKISRMLRNPVYVKADADVYLYYRNKGCIISNEIVDFIGTNGCYLYGKREANERKYTNVKDHTLSIALHEGVVDSRTWLACQYKLDSNVQIKNDGKGKNTWLSGLIKCGKCGYAATIVISDAGRYKYIKCSGKRNMKNCKGFTKAIHIGDIEVIVENLVVKKADELRETHVTEQSVDDIEANRIKLQIVDIDSKISNLMSGLAEGTGATIDYINQAIGKMDRERNKLSDQLMKLQASKIAEEPLENVLVNIDRWSELDLEDKKAICKRMIEKIGLTEDEIDIVWRV